MDLKSSNNNFAICIGRQLGSGGREIARIISRKMGIAYYDKEIITLTAKESGLAPEYFEQADEKHSTPVIGCFSETGMPYYCFGRVGGSSAYLSNDHLFNIQSETIRNLASKGPSVFVGRCADYILREMPRLLSVFITANMECRIERVSGYFSITEEEAALKIRESDRKRAEYYNYYTFKKWGDASSYDFCLNSSIMGIEETADRIIDICNEKILK